MIVTVKYGQEYSQADGMNMVSQMIDCARIYPLESETHWGFMAYDHDGKLVTKHKFALTEDARAYIMENGRTVAVLPRN